MSLRVPYLFLVGTGTASNFIPLFGSPDGTVNQDAGDIAVKMVDQYGVPAEGTPVTFTSFATRYRDAAQRSRVNPPARRLPPPPA